MAKKCIFHAEPDQCRFITTTNGDKVTFSDIHIDADNASDLAYMIGNGQTLEVKIKISGGEE